jgi:hypothetical protein
MVTILLSPGPNPLVIKFVRHSPGRRRSSDSTMYDVCCSTKECSELIRSAFAKFRRRENPVQRPAELANINIHPLVGASSVLPFVQS